MKIKYNIKILLGPCIPPLSVHRAPHNTPQHTNRHTHTDKMVTFLLASVPLAGDLSFFPLSACHFPLYKHITTPLEQQIQYHPNNTLPNISLK